MVDGAQIEASSNQAAASTGDSSHTLLHGIWDRAKEKTQSAAHTASNLMHKGATAAKEASHSPAARRATQVGTAVVNDIAHEEISHVQSAIKAGKRGDIHGAVENGLPVVEDAAKTAISPHLMIIGKAKQVMKDEAVKQAEAHVHSKLGTDHTGETTEPPKR